MSHTDKVIDSDVFFEVNAITRQIINKTPTKIRLMQNDHNSERFSFVLPRYIEGHDITECNVVEIHFINEDSTTKEATKGKYQLKDMQVASDDETKAVCSWLISKEATQKVGKLKFLLRLACVTDTEFVEYVWNTDVNSDISITSGMENDLLIPDQYEAAVQQVWNKFWDTFQDYGKRTNYMYAFYRQYWTDEIYKPKYTIDFNSSTGATSTFSYSNITDTIVDINVSNAKLENTFNGANVVTIRKLIVDNNTTFNSSFTNCSNLEKLIIDGTIGQNGFNVQWSKKITHESLMSIINALEDKSADTSGTEWKVIIGTSNMAKLTTEEINIAYDKGWVIE